MMNITYFLMPLNHVCYFTRYSKIQRLIVVGRIIPRQSRVRPHQRLVSFFLMQTMQTPMLQSDIDMVEILLSLGRVNVEQLIQHKYPSMNVEYHLGSIFDSHFRKFISSNCILFEGYSLDNRYLDRFLEDFYLTFVQHPYYQNSIQGYGMQIQDYDSEHSADHQGSKNQNPYLQERDLLFQPRFDCTHHDYDRELRHPSKRIKIEEICNQQDFVSKHDSDIASVKTDSESIVSSKSLDSFVSTSSSNHTESTRVNSQSTSKKILSRSPTDKPLANSEAVKYSIYETKFEIKGSPTAVYDSTPREQSLKSVNDLYTPKWVRFSGSKKEGLCDVCVPGRWLQLKDSAYW